VAYVVLPTAENPFLLARVRWPDVYQAISPVRPDWQEDPGLFDLPYAPTSVHVSYEEAAAIAADWGAELPAENEKSAGPSLIRRMPSDWSELSTAERRAWSVEIDKSGRQAMAAASVRRFTENQVVPAESSPAKRRWWRRRAGQPVLSATSAAQPTFDLKPREQTIIIDLTDVETAGVAVEPA
jgi:hypothetical protein